MLCKVGLHCDKHVFPTEEYEYFWMASTRKGMTETWWLGRSCASLSHVFQTLSLMYPDIHEVWLRLWHLTREEKSPGPEICFLLMISSLIFGIQIS